MIPISKFDLWYGRNEPPQEIVKLKAGKLDLEFEGIDLRYIRYSGQELIRRIYVAIRDHNWNTIPARISNLSLESGDDCFKIQFDAFHKDGSLVFRWRGSIEGNHDGTIEYAMRGVAESEFRFCRIGFCILHPIEGIAGRPYRARTLEGDIEGILPELVEPQRIDENGFEAPIFPSCSNISIDTSSGVRIITGFEGDLFEMEDQRNWTDGSFKTYSTPISLGYPNKAEADQVFFQKVTIRADLIRDLEEVVESQAGNIIGLNIEGETSRRFVKIGFGLARNGDVSGTRELELLSKLRPAHLKFEIHFQDCSWVSDLNKAIAITQLVNSELEMVIFLTDDSEDALQELKSKLHDVPVARVIVFHEVEAPTGTTSPHWIEFVRQQLSDALPRTQFVGGTNGNFAEINRQRPDISVMDGVSYTINPQVHKSDERSLIEAIEAQEDTVVSARSYCGALPIAISSVTLKPPFNQAATEQEAPQEPDELPANVDQRQMSLFAAAWTVGSIRSLAMGGASSITYYETTGWRGLMETGNGSPLPDKFRSFPGMVFPVYWVFSFLDEKTDRILLNLKSEKPLLLEGLAFRTKNYTRVMVANLQPCSQEVRIHSLPNGTATLSRLNADSMDLASSNPDAFIKLSEPLTIHNSEVSRTLEPYEIAFLEIHLQE